MAGGKQTDEPKVKVYDWGAGGVQLVKDPLQLADNELTQAQNGEIVPDVNKGGVGSLSKRGGLAALTSALAGSILGMVSLPLQTTFTRTLMASLDVDDADTWLRSSDGTTWTAISTPSRASTFEKQDIGSGDYKGNRRAVSFKTGIYYPGDDHTVDFNTPGSNTSPPLVKWDGTASHEVMRLGAGPSSDGNYPFSITDMLVANGKIYFAVHDPTNGGTPNLKGRVLEFDPSTNIIKQVANAFGGGTGEVSGGAPCCLAWCLGQLFVGLDYGTGDNDLGKIVRCYPDVDTSWTTDITGLKTQPFSMTVYRGDLYVGLSGNATYVARVLKRTSSTGLYADSDTQVTSGVHYYSSLYVYNDALYAIVFSNGGTDLLLIRKFDGSSWSTERDVAANDSSGVALHAGEMVKFGDDLYVAFRASGATVADGFILKRTAAGTWSKVTTENINGRLVVLTERS